MKIPGLYTWQDIDTIYWSDDFDDVPRPGHYYQRPPIDINVVDLIGTMKRIEQLLGKHVWIKFDDFFYSSQQGGELSDR